MINTTPHTFDPADEARRRGWCEHELTFRLCEYGISEELRSMEAHMMALEGGSGLEVNDDVLVPEPPNNMVNTTLPTFDFVGEARKRGWCEHDLMYHIFEFGTSEGMRSMEMHMMALAAAEEGSQSVLRCRRIMELAAEEDEANSVVFPGGVLQEDNSVGEFSSSSWQWPWAASGEINMWNPLLLVVAVRCAVIWRWDGLFRGFSAFSRSSGLSRS